MCTRSAVRPQHPSVLSEPQRKDAMTSSLVLEPNCRQTPRLLSAYGYLNDSIPVGKLEDMPAISPCLPTSLKLSLPQTLYMHTRFCQPCRATSMETMTSRPLCVSVSQQFCRCCITKAGLEVGLSELVACPSCTISAAYAVLQ